jgi:hypothetical protein
LPCSRRRVVKEGELDEKDALLDAAAGAFGEATGMRRGNGEGPPLRDERRVDVDVALLGCALVVSLRGIVVAGLCWQYCWQMVMEDGRGRR